MRKTIIILFFIPFFTSCKRGGIDDELHNGFTLSKDKKYEEAIKVYTDVIKQDGKLQLAYYNRGQCYFDIKNYPKALADFDTVMALQEHSNAIITDDKNASPANAQVTYYEALYQRAQVYFYMDSMNNSFQDFQLLVDNNYEEKINCILWEGSIWMKAGEKERACIYYNKAKELALKDVDKQQADKMIQNYCSRTVAIDSIKNLSAKK